MQIGCFYDVITAGVKEMGFENIDACLEDARKQGICSVDVCSAFLEAEEPEIFASRLKRYGIEIASVHGFLRCPYKTKEEREKSINDMCKAMDLAKRAGTSRFMIVPQKPLPFDESDIEILREFIIEVFRESAKYGKRIGLIPTVENYSDRFYNYTTVEDIEYLLAEIPELSFTYDSGNFPLAGISEVEAAKVLAKRTVYCHLKDLVVCEKSNILRNGKYYDSVAIGDGFMDNKKAIDILKEAGYDGPLMIEICGNADKYKKCKKSIEYLKSIGV